MKNRNLTFSNKSIRAKRQLHTYKNDLWPRPSCSQAILRIFRISSLLSYSHAESDVKTSWELGKCSLLIADGVQSVFPYVEVYNECSTYLSLSFLMVSKATALERDHSRDWGWRSLHTGQPFMSQGRRCWAFTELMYNENDIIRNWRRWNHNEICISIKSRKTVV